MNDHFRINGSPTADGYYTTYAPDEVTIDSGSGGGGGSSDFSSAQVTIIADSNDPTTGELSLPNVFDDGEIHPALTVNAYTATRTVVLYQNLLQIYDDDENPIIKSTSGAIELVEEGQYAITGDCSITVKQFSFS